MLYSLDMNAAGLWQPADQAGMLAGWQWEGCESFQVCYNQRLMTRKWNDASIELSTPGQVKKCVLFPRAQLGSAGMNRHS